MSSILLDFAIAITFLVVVYSFAPILFYIMLFFIALGLLGILK